MKKAILAFCCAVGVFAARADVITNYVYVVSNIFHNVYSESIVTQKVKSSHTDYYFTNHVTTVNNVYETTFRTNVDVTVVFDNFEPWVAAASNAAARASSSASTAADYAGSAQRYESGAQSFASTASAAASSASSAASDGLARINERINWFDQHSGETITMITTNVNISVVTNLTVQEIEVDYTGAFGTPAESVYTNHVSGTVWPKIKTHPYGADGGATIRAFQNETYAGVNMKVWPVKRSGGDPWYFVPAYIDSDDKGMRLQYLPTNIEDMNYSDTSTTYTDRKIVPEYLYWQDGYFYIKINWWKNGSIGGWIKGKLKYDTYPRPINYSNTDNGTGYGITILSRSNYNGPSVASYAGWFYHHTRNSNALSFPQTITPALVPMLNWMQHGP